MVIVLQIIVSALIILCSKKKSAVDFIDVNKSEV